MNLGNINLRLAYAVLPLLVTSLWYFTFLVLAATSLAEDVGISSESCGKATHIWKYCFLNAIFGLIFLVRS